MRDYIYIHIERCGDVMLYYVVSGIQEALVLGTVEGTVDLVPVLNLLRQWLCVYLHVPAHQIPPRHFEEIQDIKKLLQQCSACKQHNERKQNTLTMNQYKHSLFCCERYPRNRQ